MILGRFFLFQRLALPGKKKRPNTNSWFLKDHDVSLVFYKQYREAADGVGFENLADIQHVGVVNILRRDIFLRQPKKTP